LDKLDDNRGMVPGKVDQPSHIYDKNDAVMPQPTKKQIPINVVYHQPTQPGKGHQLSQHAPPTITAGFFQQL